MYCQCKRADTYALMIFKGDLKVQGNFLWNISVADFPNISGILRCVQASIEGAYNIT